MDACVLHITDTHFRAQPGDLVLERDPDVGLAETLQAVNRTTTRIDLVVLGGDLTEDGSLEATMRVKVAVDALRVPVVAIPGNHDSPRVVAEVFGLWEPRELGRWRILPVDTTVRNEIAGRVEPGRLMKTIDELDGWPTLLVAHHPPVSPSTHAWFQLAGAEEMMALLAARSHVHGLLTGHLHEAFEAVTVGRPAIYGGPSTLIGFVHQAADVTIDPLHLTGARLLRLGDRGAICTTLVPAARHDRAA